MNIHLPNRRAGRHTTDMEILENPLEWLREFQDGWLSKFENSGAIDWSLYAPPRNLSAPNSRGINLSESRLMLITTVGAYSAERQFFFNSAHPLGDYSIRQVPISANVEDLAIAHPDLDLQYINQDSEVILPVQHLNQMVSEGIIGSLAPVFISYCGFQPHAIRIVKELIPAILRTVKKHHVHAALIVPAGALSIQSAGLVARALEVNDIATTMTCWDGDLARQTAPPRGTATNLSSDNPIGLPGKKDQQRKLLEATLALLEKDAPTGIVDVDLG